ncbi:PstS family phosphate ABC transporter substrate-binding protein [Thermotalea metallivorans]|uniref:Phosphate-binding protein n=1 Tax=Thermotalea metallivorans TaxID=520762 RepID=A0A140L1H2_9FIRM|nr:PstS family phosphate ABC transporter substrate-binding protein [Thermotalea metallivorans]KXG74397.1 Phosphate-binding protein PstS [Thermotalea metallivorans]
MKLLKKKMAITAMILALIMLALAGCGSKSGNQSHQEPAVQEARLSGEIKIDGSSTVFPITEAIAEEFIAMYPEVKIPIGVSGTGGGFKKFVNKETDISNASRPIKDKEAEAAKGAGVEYIELKVAYDGLSVLVNPQNTWVDSLTVEELKKIWAPDSTVKTWKDVRPEWPAEEIKFYAPGTDSGTFDYFTEEINGKSGAIRQDFVASEDDNVLVQGIAGDKNALGFFGYAYYVENKDKLKVVKIDNGNGPVEPTFKTIQDGSYAPLSRPIFIYVNKAALERPEVKEFTIFYLEKAKEIVPQVGYVALPDEEYKKGLSLVK